MLTNKKGWFQQYYLKNRERLLSNQEKNISKLGKYREKKTLLDSICICTGIIEEEAAFS